MRDKQSCASPGRTLQSIDNSSFRGGVQPAGWFIKNQNGGTTQNCSGDCDSLFLAAGKGRATLGDQGLIAIWKNVNELRGVGHDSGRDDLLTGGARASESDVLPDSPTEKQGIL